MVEFVVTIKKFDKAGDKTGWTYIEISQEVSEQIKPGQKKSYKVKGFLDKTPVKGLSLLPAGEGNFILALSATIRKKIGKGHGAMLKLRLAADNTQRSVPHWMIECLEDEPEARDYFFSLANSHQDYFISWVDSAKTEATRTKRLAMAVTAFSRKMTFGEMTRWGRENSF